MVSPESWGADPTYSTAGLCSVRLEAGNDNGGACLAPLALGAVPAPGTFGARACSRGGSWL